MLTTEQIEKDKLVDKKFLDELNEVAMRHGYYFRDDDPASIYFLVLAKHFLGMKKELADQIKGDNYICLADFTMQESRMLGSYRKAVNVTLKQAVDNALKSFLDKTTATRSQLLGEMRDTVSDVKNQCFTVTTLVKQKAQFLVGALVVSTAVNAAAAAFVTYLLLTH